MGEKHGCVVGCFEIAERARDEWNWSLLTLDKVINTANDLNIAILASDAKEKLTSS